MTPATKTFAEAHQRKAELEPAFREVAKDMVTDVASVRDAIKRVQNSKLGMTRENILHIDQDLQDKVIAPLEKLANPTHSQIIPQNTADNIKKYMNQIAVTLEKAKYFGEPNEQSDKLNDAIEKADTNGFWDWVKQKEAVDKVNTRMAR